MPKNQQGPSTTTTAVGGVPLGVWQRLTDLAAADGRSAAELLEELVRKEEQHRAAQEKAAGEYDRSRRGDFGEGRWRRFLTGAEPR